MTVSTTYAGAIGVQYQAADLSWVTVGVCDAGSILRSRRIAFPPRKSVTARKWRVVRLSGGDLGTAKAQLGKVAFWRETAALSAHKRWSFDFDTAEQRYGLIATEGNVEVFRRGQRVASVAVPYTESQVLAVKRAQSLDTLLTFHSEVPPRRIGRQGSHTEWDSRPQPFENVPIYDYTGSKAGGVNEKHQLKFKDFNDGDTFNLSIETETTASIAYSTNMATLAANVQAALTALPNIGAGGASVVSPSGLTLTITYVGPSSAEDVGEIVTGVLSSDTGIIRVATITQGKGGGEPVMSAARGWPATGLFYDGRLWMGGLASRPQTLLASRNGFFFDLQTRGADPSKAIDVDLATDQSTRIMGLFGGRHLQVFSQSAEFFCASQPITPPPAIPRTTSVGIQPNTPLFDLEGGTLFVQAGGGTVSRYLYDDSVQNYVVQPLSSYASHLTQGIIGGGFRRHRSTSEPHLALWIRADGKAAAMTALLTQDVLAFTPWTTDGAFTEAGGELAGDLYVCTRRQAGGVDSHRLEVLDERHMLDASILIDGPCTEITGLEHLEGRSVVLYVDGGDAGDAVVAAGKVTLPRPALRSAEAGLLFVPRGRLLPLVLTEDPRAGGAMRARAGEVNFHLGPTANLWAGMTGKRLWPLRLKSRPTALLDHGPGEDAHEGWARLYPLSGFQQDAQIDWAQPRPGPLEIKEVVVTVQS